MRLCTISPESTIDYPDKFGPVFFTKDCNLRCGYCFALKDNGEVSPADLEKAMQTLKTKVAGGWYTGATVCGGEPTLQYDLIDFLKRLKTMVPVKLDTNGTNPKVLREVIDRGLVDYIAMDVKAPRELYDKITGVPGDYGHITESMEILSQFGNHEFRTTFDPRLNPQSIQVIAQEIVGITGKNDHAYFIQPFVPVQGKIFNADLEKFPQTPKQDLEKALMLAKEHLPNTKIR